MVLMRKFLPTVCRGLYISTWMPAYNVSPQHMSMNTHIHPHMHTQHGSIADVHLIASSMYWHEHEIM